jgi:hypothetical protein
MLYNILGYGFLFLKKRDEEKYNEIKDSLISPIFTSGGKNILGIPKKTFLKVSTIGKLFIVKDASSKDDSNLESIEEGRKELSRSTRAVTTISKNNNFMFNKKKTGNIVNQNENENDNIGPNKITFKGDSKSIINDVIENTIQFYKNSKEVWPHSHILKFYNKQSNENEEKIIENKFIGMGVDELSKKIIDEEKRINRTLKETIPFLEGEIRKYWNNSCLDQLKRRREYKKTKKRLFSWNGFWSERKLFFAHPEYLKLQVKNHFTKDMTKVILTPILDIDYYLPNFSKFNKKKLFNKDDFKYVISLNVEEILNISDNKNEEENKNINNININKQQKDNKDKIADNFSSLDELYNYIQGNNEQKGKKKSKKHKKKKKNKADGNKNKNGKKQEENVSDPVVEEFIQYFKDFNKKNEGCIKIKPKFTEKWLKSLC